MGVYDYENHLCYEVNNGTVTMKAGGYFTFKLSDGLAQIASNPTMEMTYTMSPALYNSLKMEVTGNTIKVTHITDTTLFSPNNFEVVIKAGGKELWRYMVLYQNGHYPASAPGPYNPATGNGVDYYEKENGVWANKGVQRPYSNYASNGVAAPSTCS